MEKKKEQIWNREKKKNNLEIVGNSSVKMRRGFTDTRLAKYMQTASNSIYDLQYRQKYTVQTKDRYSTDQKIFYKLYTIYTYRS